MHSSHWSSLRAQADLSTDPDFEACCCSCACCVHRHFEGSHEAFLTFVGMLARSKACYLNSICTKRSEYNVMKVVSAIHAYFASACICLAEVIPKVSDKCRRPTNPADTLVFKHLFVE